MSRPEAKWTSTGGSATVFGQREMLSGESRLIAWYPKLQLFGFQGPQQLEREPATGAAVIAGLGFIDGL